MTPLESWRQTFNECCAAGLRLPDWADWASNGQALFDGASECGECMFPDEAALALCRWTAFVWLDYPNIDENIHRYRDIFKVGTYGAHRGSTIDAALQAACRAKAASPQSPARDCE